MSRFKIKKQTIWRWHSVLGLTAGLGLLVIGITGSLLMFSTEIDGLLLPEIATTEVKPEGRLPFDTLVSRAAAAHPDHTLAGWEMDGSVPEATDRVWVREGNEEQWKFFYLDPYTGEALSEPAKSNEQLTGWLLELHYTFLGDHVGMLAAGLFALMLFLLGLTGLWLYRDLWKHFFRLRWGKSARILFADFHRMIGISSVLFHLILGFTGAWWNLSHLLGHLVEEAPADMVEAEPLPRAEWSSVEGMLEKAPEVIDGYTARFVSFPRADAAEVKLFGHHGDPGPLRGIYGSTITFAAASGEVTDQYDMREATPWQQIYDSFMPLHYGTFGGWPIKILWCLGGLTPGLLAISGFIVWRKRQPVRAVDRRPLQPELPTEMARTG